MIMPKRRNMNAEDYFLKIKKFLEEQNISHKVVSNLKTGVEIGIVIEGLDCAYFKENNLPVLEKRKANNPDIIFELAPETVDILSQFEGGSVGEFGVEVVKQYLAGGIKVKILGPAVNFLTRGYLGIVKEGGLEFAGYLSAHGISGLAKWNSFLQKMKSKN